MNWEALLEEGECIRWEGRPAPRCFSFRKWRRSFFGILLLLASSFLEGVSIQVATAYDLTFLHWIPAPFMLASLGLIFGHPVLARLEWENVFFVITDRRVLSRRGLFRPRLKQLPLEKMAYFRLKPLGKELASLCVEGDTPPKRLYLPCLEHPRRVVDLLESALADSGRIQRREPPLRHPVDFSKSD